MKPGIDDTCNMSWEAPVKGDIVTGGSSLFVVGCGVGVYFFGHDANNPIGYCVSICLDNKGAMKEANANHYDPYANTGIGSCSILLGQDVRAFGLRIARLNGGVSALSGQGQSLSTSVKVFLAEDYNFRMSDINSSQIDE